MLASQSLVASACYPFGVLLLSIPIAVAIIQFAHVFVPEVVLRTKEIDIGPAGTKTLTFGPLSAPNDAALSAAYISIISSILCAIGLVLVRLVHGRKRGLIARRTTIGLAAANILGQIACIAAWAILQGKDDAKVPAEGVVQYVDGEYNTDGRILTKEAWACTMDKYFSEREDWAHKACANMVSRCMKLFG